MGDSVKYYAKIEEAQAASRDRPPLDSFDLRRLDKPGFTSRIKRRITTRLLASHLFYRLLRFLPILKLQGVYIVTRYDDVKAVREHQDVFEVPYGLEMTELAGGTNFVLGMPRGPAYDRQKTHITTALRGADIQDIIIPTASSIAGDLVEISGGKIDAVEDLVMRVPAEVCATYFGLEVDDPLAFAEWLMALSALLFADYFGDPATRELALTGAQRVRSVIERSIAQAKARSTPRDDTLVDRFVAMQAQPDGPNDKEIVAMLTGLAVGFVPTTTLAAAHILETLFGQKQAMQQAASAARADDDPRLERCLMEAMRFKPPIIPGLPRYAKQRFTLSKDRWWPTTISENDVVVAATMSAMLDPDRVKAPETYDPNRQLHNDLGFGGKGLDHYCLGERIARAQITATLKPLLRQKHLRKGRLDTVGPFPRHMTVRFEPEDGQRTQSMITICVPMAPEANYDAVETAIRSLGNPANPSIRHALDATRRIHFASLNAIKGEAREPSYVVFELNADGPVHSAIDIVCDKAWGELRPIFESARGIADLEQLKRCLKDNVVHLKATPFACRHTTSGLNFPGTPELPVTRIDKEKPIADAAFRVVSQWVAQKAHLALPAMMALQSARDELIKNGTLKRRLMRPLGKPLAISRHADLGTLEAIKSLKNDHPLIVRFTALVFGMALLRFFKIWHGGPVVNWPDSLAALPSFVISQFYGLFYVIVLALLILAVLVYWLRRQEDSDAVQDIDPPEADLKKLMALENRPGYVQNHLTAITPLKTGWLRRLTLAVAFWGIDKLVKHRFRPGFILDIGTIHFARWFRLPKTGKLVFLTNYDGSWESYLEDFITKAHYGQTAVWSNGIGFPRTRFLILDGAEDGSGFKRWVRGQQVPTAFWYSRFPELTTDQIRNNALICYGLANAKTESEARAWMDLFNSQPRPPSAIELHEIQSLVFGPLGKFQSAELVLLRFPDNPAQCREWLRDVMDIRNQPSSAVPPGAPSIRIQRAGYQLPFPDPLVSFGDVLVDKKRAMNVAFSVGGLQRLNPETMDEKSHTLHSFPSPFIEGMDARSKILGDLEASAPGHWKWGMPGQIPDAVLLLYAETPHELDSFRQAEQTRLLRYGLTPFHSIRMQDMTNPKRSREPFGFRDGISQPIIRGSKRFNSNTNRIHVVEPGELVLGYKDNHGYFPPTPIVSAENDRNCILPNTPPNLPDRFPAFAGEVAYAPRDLGRNGSFLVIRQLKQDVTGFHNFLDRTSHALSSRYHAPRLTPDWVAAKMVGRWPDGGSIFRHPEESSTEEDNDFLPGVEDPQGLRCPYGAHIRRANPRDSLEPGSDEQIQISNRHRILRVGRPYLDEPVGTERVGTGQTTDAEPQKAQVNAPGEPRQNDNRIAEASREMTAGVDGWEAVERTDKNPKGLLFMCINADIERQFEFLQQTWINSSHFHGLKDEPDPLVGTSGLSSSQTTTFTLPTTVGPLEIAGLPSFVTVKGGGYFFLPSRSALGFLSQDP
jgi:cytochrome P450/deferrochelatase/peroxidase EfeB